MEKKKSQGTSNNREFGAKFALLKSEEKKIYLSDTDCFYCCKKIWLPRSPFSVKYDTLIKAKKKYFEHLHKMGSTQKLL